MNLPREAVQRLFDMCVNSMDFGSGFLESGDVEVLRDVAVRLGVDPLKGTPQEFMSNYPHPLQAIPAGRWCRCMRREDDPIHQAVEA